MSTFRRNLGGNLNPQVELFGDWAKTRKLIKLLPALILAGSVSGQQSAAIELKRIVKRNIRNNGASLGWAPLADSYKKKKTVAGYPANRIYYASGSYYRSIKIWTKDGRVYIGIKAGAKSLSSKKKLTIGKIARILEYGSMRMNIPARPLWVPSFKEFGGTRRIKGFIIWHIRNTIYLRTGVKAKITF